MNFLKKLKIAFALRDDSFALSAMLRMLENKNDQYVICQKTNFGVNGNFVRYAPRLEFNETQKIGE